MGIDEFQRLGGGGGGGGEVSSILCSPVLDMGYMIDTLSPPLCFV